MKLLEIEINNYRNLDGITVTLDPDCSFLVGRNNIGKSNFLALLETIFFARSFKEDDFFDIEAPIDIRIKLQLAEPEWGIMDDNFDPANCSFLNIRIFQESTDPYLKATALDSNSIIRLADFRKNSFFKYDSLANPSKELRIDGSKGMKYLFERIVAIYKNQLTCPEQYVEIEAVNRVKNYLNERLKKIRLLDFFPVKATISEESCDLLGDIFFLSTDDERRIDIASSGVQFMTMSAVSLLCHIAEIYRGRGTKFEERKYDENGKTKLPLILALDEPEVHLHPFLQRSLIKFYQKIINNEDKGFLSLIKDLFGIDEIVGQLIIVTHSADIIMGDYRNIVRFYKINDQLKVECGNNLMKKWKVVADNEKHYFAHYKSFKEAFFAQGAFIVEGETEEASFPLFAKTMGYDLDEYGISIINGRGKGTLKYIWDILNCFGIKAYAFFDRDFKPKYEDQEWAVYPKECDFETEIIKTLLVKNEFSLILEIVNQVCPPKKKEEIESSFSLLSEGLEREEEVLKVVVDAISERKGYRLGQVIGEFLTEDLIPHKYKEVFLSLFTTIRNNNL